MQSNIQKEKKVIKTGAKTSDNSTKMLQKAQTQLRGTAQLLKLAEMIRNGQLRTRAGTPPLIQTVTLIIICQ